MPFLSDVGLDRVWQKMKEYIDEKLSAGSTASANKLTTARALEGVLFDGSAARHHYAACSTSGSTAAKTCSITGFSLVTGARVIVRFSYANTASNPTLNVSSTGAKAIYYKGSAIPAAYIKQYSVLELVYSGSYWYVVGDLTQSQVDSLAANMSGPVQLWSGSLYSTLSTWKYETIAALADYDEIRVWVEVGDASRGYHTITRKDTQICVSGYTNASYYGCVYVKWDTTNNQIGIYVLQKAGSWGDSVFKVTRVEGIRKL